jgi:hypothetical protein
LTEDRTDIWKLYERGRDHHNRAMMYSDTDRAHRFFEGDQWYGLESGGETLPVYNFIQPTCEYKIAMVALKSMAIRYTSPGGGDRLASVACASLGRMAAQTWEQTRMDKRLWEIVREACIAGDSYLYFYDGGRSSQLVDNVDLYLSDEQQRDLQKQSYLILYERRPVGDVKADARKNGLSEDDIAGIAPDADSADLLGDAKNEVKTDEGKCSCLLYLTRRDGEVRYARTTKTVVYQPETAVPGMTLYPVAGFVWAPKKGSARGKGEVSQLIANQIECNRLLARRMVSTKLSAFPKPVFSSSAIANPDDIDAIGAKIEIQGGVQKVADAFAYIQPAAISGDAHALQQELISVTQRMASTGDAALGNVNPEQASGAAIVAARDQSAIPLNEQSAMLRQFVEDVARVWLDMACAYNPDGIVASDNGEPVSISPRTLRELRLNVRVDVSPIDPFSKYAQEQHLLGLLQGGAISFEEFVGALDDDASVPKGKLTEIVRQRGDAEPPQAPGALARLLGQGGDPDGQTVQM